ncbi:MAG: 50S ribosomal protein L11 methyltransferase, partial [Roseinatronobacter sp.]
VVDIGCGTAVLAMAAAKIWPQPVLASDIDAIAVEVAQVNIEANELTDRVRCLEATGFDHPDLQAACPFDLVFANILMGPLIELAPEMGRVTATGGHAILSGLLVEQAEQVLAAYVAAGFTLHHREDIGDWATLTLLR